MAQSYSGPVLVKHVFRQCAQSQKHHKVLYSSFSSQCAGGKAEAFLHAMWLLGEPVKSSTGGGWGGGGREKEMGQGGEWIRPRRE